MKILGDVLIKIQAFYLLLFNFTNFLSLTLQSTMSLNLKLYFWYLFSFDFGFSFEKLTFVFNLVSLLFLVFNLCVLRSRN